MGDYRFAEMSTVAVLERRQPSGVKASVEMTILVEHRTLRFHERSVEPQIPRLRSG